MTPARSGTARLTPVEFLLLFPEMAVRLTRTSAEYRRAVGQGNYLLVKLTELMPGECVIEVSVATEQVPGWLAEKEGGN